MSAEETKALQEGAVMGGGDPEVMTLEADGQGAFDQMWASGTTVTPDGYLDRPIEG